MNTAEALGAIFEMVREGNTAMDRGEFKDGDRGAFLDTLEHWNQVFAVMDDDHSKLVRLGFIKSSDIAVAEESGAHRAGAVGETGSGQPLEPVGTLSDESIAKLIAERAEARHRGDYGRSDDIRGILLKAGVILEDTKAGARWRRR